MSLWLRPSLVIACTLVLLARVTNAQTTVHVDDDAKLGGDDLTWPTAFRYLQDALSVAAGPDSGVTQIL